MNDDLDIPSVLGARRSGVLLHLSSMPDPQRRGVLGDAAHRFIDLIADAGFGLWQVLPVSPCGDDGSPYFSWSAHAGDPRFIDRAELASSNFESHEYAQFVERHRSWLADDALFIALKGEQQGRWWEWPAALRDRDPAALDQARSRHGEALERFAREQFLFHRQWQVLRSHAHARGVQLFGDIPIYLAHDSAEVWAHRQDFLLDAQGRPTAVSGVPPDYFSKDGQLWGNPLYDWARMQAGSFASWTARFRTQLERFDLVRIDHFRGLESYWAVPANARTARDGQWRKAPGEALLSHLFAVFGQLPVVAEDLGLITPEVHALRDRFNLPGMRVLQFAFDGSSDNPHLPANYSSNTVAYTGTHDNDTTLGWFRGLDTEMQQRVCQFLQCGAPDIPSAAVRAVMESAAELAVIPLQDLLGLGSQARMNTPGTNQGNWGWVLDWSSVPADFAAHWRSVGEKCGRA